MRNEVPQTRCFVDLPHNAHAHSMVVGISYRMYTTEFMNKCISPFATEKSEAMVVEVAQRSKKSRRVASKLRALSQKKIAEYSVVCHAIAPGLGASIYIINLVHLRLGIASRFSSESGTHLHSWILALARGSSQAKWFNVCICLLRVFQWIVLLHRCAGLEVLSSSHDLKHELGHACSSGSYHRLLPTGA